MTTTGMESMQMSDEPETYDATEPDESKWGALRMIGLLALLAAFAGFVYLAYMQGVRNGSVGAPPVITAENGPYKIAPQDPGGRSFSNEDKMIFDRVEGSMPGTGSAAAQPPSAAAEAAPPPVPPVTMASDDDVVSHKPAPLVVAESQAPPASVPSSPASRDQRADGIAAAIERADHNGVGGPIDEADEILPKETDSATLASPPLGTGTTASTDTQVSIPAPVTLIPPPESDEAATPARVPAATSGTYVVQIASYRDKPAAEDAWTKFSASFADVAAKLSPDYQTADIPGKGTYYRLRVGPFLSKDEANALCQTLKARNQGCLVVKS